MAASVTNMEEAASVAAEYVASLDNLPTEIQFLLAEIKHKETRSQELAQDIQKETSKYIRHALRNSGSSNGASSVPSKDTSAAALAKDAAIPAKVAEQHSQIDMLAQEKIVLAQRVVTLLTRARSRLDHDLARVLVLQGDLAPNMLNSYASASAGSIRGPAGAITDSLRHALAGGAPVGIGEPVTLVSARLSSPVPPANKKRKVASGASVKLSSPAPSGVVGAAVLGGSSAAIGSGRGRGSAASAATPGGAAGARSVPAAHRGRRAVVQQVVEEMSEDGVEEEADVLEGEGEDAEDNNTYCFCQRKSFGEMVGCDNPDCPYQWFHLECVNLTTPLPDQWYCSECTAKGHAEKPRKGRKK